MAQEPTGQLAPQREHWASRLGVILAVAGSAVGLGNFLRFPGRAAMYGGGAFMIPYLISLLLIGIPICWCEWTLGRYGGARGYNSAPGIFRIVAGFRGAHFIGVVALIIPVVIYMYYVYIESWCLAYAYDYARGALPLGTKATEDYVTHFDSFVGFDQDGFLRDERIQPVVVFLLIAFVINFYLIYRGLSRGIEAFCKVAMPMLILAAVIVLVRVLTLGTPNAAIPEQNVNNGLGYMWNPKIPEGKGILHVLSNPEIWLEAAGQIFFSLSVGFGIIMTYASYLRKRDDVVLSGLTASATNEFCEVCLGGLITVPAAFIFLGGAAIQATEGSSLGLGFKTLPMVFEYMPAGRFFGFLWFFLLFLAAITSSLSMLQPAIAFLEEGLGLRRRMSVALLGLITAIGSLFVVYFSKNLTALDTMDFWVGSVLIFVLATIIVIVFGWVFGLDRGFEEAHRGSHLRIPRVFRFIIKYVSPVYLLVIFAGFLSKNVGEKIRGMDSAAALTIGFVLILIVFFALLVHLAGKAWQERERRAVPVTSP